MHAATLKASVKKFLPMMQESKTEQEIKDAIGEDEKNFSEEDVNEIYKALALPPDATVTKLTVISEFRDLNNFNKTIEVGEDVSHFNAERIENLIELGLVEKEQ